MDVLSLLQERGIDYTQKEKDNVYVECKNCLKNKLSINLDTGMYHCYSRPSCEHVKGHINKWLGLSSTESSTMSTTLRVPKIKVLKALELETIKRSLQNKAGLVRWAISRGFETKDLKKLQGMVGIDKNGAVVFPFRNADDKIIGAKFKLSNGDMFIRGQEPELYFPVTKHRTKKNIVVVEGEEDALTLVVTGIPVCACLGTAKVERGIETLSKFKGIYLGLDNDESGDGAALQYAELLGGYRCKRITWDFKDPNDMLQEGANEEDFFRCLKSASICIKETSSRSMKDLIREHQLSEMPPTRTWGFKDIDKLLGGLPLGAIIGILAEGGAGKTTFIYNVCAKLAFRKIPSAICSLEENPVSEVSPKVTATIVGRNPGGAKHTSQELKKYDEVIDRVQVYEGKDQLHDVIKWIRETYYLNGTRVVFVDYLQLLVADETNVQKVKQACYSFKRVVLDLPDLTIIMVIQPKQKPTLFHKGEFVSKDRLEMNDARGGASIGQSLDALATIRGVKGEPDLTQLEFVKVRGHLRVSKRHWLGKTVTLEYDHATMRQKVVRE